MRKTFLFLAALFTATVMNLNADNTVTLYLNTGGNTLWNQGGAKFSVYYWNDGVAGKFTDFLAPAIGETDIYRAIIPMSDSVIFVRHAATADVPSWDNKLHYTKGEKVDLEDNGNIMVVNGWELADLAWDNYTPKPDPEDVTFEETGSKADITPYLTKLVNATIKRTFYKDGGNNTICLPFSLTADQLAASPLAGYSELKEFTSAEIVNPGKPDETLELTMSDATAITAGKPYIITWANGDDLVNPVFNNATITTDEASVSEKKDGVQFCGTFVPKAVEKDDKGILFVGTGAELKWPNVAGNINGYRAYFKLDLSASSPLRQGMKAMLAGGKTTPTGIDSMDEFTNLQIYKLIESGRVVIISNGVRYDLNGNIVK